MNPHPISARHSTTERLNVISEKLDKPLRECVHIAMTHYLQSLGDAPGHNLFQMVMDEVEAPLLRAVMAHVRGNQTRAATLLGMSRSTLRKKLTSHGIE